MHVVEPRVVATAFVLFAIWHLSRRLRLHMYKKLTCIHELSSLGTKRRHKLDGTAVICGGSISGLLTARICSDHFERVLVVEPESPNPDVCQSRSRILQSDSLHGYLTFFFDSLCRLWPTFETEVEQMAGIIRPGDFKTHYGGVLIAPPFKEYGAHGLPKMMILRRTTLETLLQRLVFRTCPNVQSIKGTVRRLVQSHDSRQIDSVVVRTHHGHQEQVNDVRLVADCTGATQAGLKWLKSAGYEIPHNLRVSYDQKMHYVTIHFTVSKLMRSTLPIPGGYDQVGFIYTFVADYRWGNTGFTLSRMDGDMIELCFGGWGVVDLPQKPDDIDLYIRSLRGPAAVPTWVVETLMVLKTEGNPIFHPVKIPPCSWIRYHMLTRIPSNFVAIGDAEMQLNPIFAQGCSKAMLDAITLNSLLLSYDNPRQTTSLPENFAKTFFRKISDRIKPLWDSTKALDYGFETTEPVVGETRACGHTMRWFTDRVLSAAEQDQEVASALWHVRMLLAPTTDFFTPVILIKMAYTSCRMWWHGRRSI